jgi:hypothetical protein
MSANAYNIATILPTTPVYQPFIAEDTSQQNSANSLYQSLASTITASNNGTLGAAANGQPIFKSHRDRMQYLLGMINQTGSYSKRPAVALGTN